MNMKTFPGTEWVNGRLRPVEVRKAKVVVVVMVVVVVVVVVVVTCTTTIK
ncbi:hypothetical protein E2C01_068118 [Portunus trituberculatus]|uniref:Uncharacterized protein n=1 Tax=Portunus trituberculatus TaxID=210409 RepID=A0A5B7HLL3_PORTR|nr:hypothetical protein [Portunus trituberculatus]